MKSIHTQNENETKKLASQIAKLVKPGMTLLLEGELGAGKTTFTKGFAEGLGISRIIKSPTYTLIREYTDGRMPLYHMDLYRLDETGAEELGLEEYFEGDGVCIVEWSSMSPDELPENHLTIKLEVIVEAPFEREITLTATGKEYTELLKKLNE